MMSGRAHDCAVAATDSSVATVVASDGGRILCRGVGVHGDRHGARSARDTMVDSATTTTTAAVAAQSGCRGVRRGTSEAMVVPSKTAPEATRPAWVRRMNEMPRRLREYPQICCALSRCRCCCWQIRRLHDRCCDQCVELPLRRSRWTRDFGVACRVGRRKMARRQQYLPMQHTRYPMVRMNLRRTRVMSVPTQCRLVSCQ